VPHWDHRDRVNYLTALCRTVPYHIVDAVLTDPRDESVRFTTIDGSLLFADLVGFTAMCERLARGGPEGLSSLGRILSGLFESLLEQAIFPYSGYVVHFGGDSVTTIFRGEDHARRAAAAALTAERLVHGEVGRLVGGKSRELMLRMGLASGEIRLPVIGDMTQRVVVASGPVAHRALAMQQLAPPGGIMADSGFLEHLGSVAEVIDRHADRGMLRGLRSWPRSVPVEELGDRVLEQVEEKIALLEPFVPAALTGRLMSMPIDWRIEGELRPMVIVFTEVWGIDEKAANVELAMNIGRSVSRAFRKYGGVISKVDLAQRGHRSMILFGLHRPSDNDAERATLAALEATTRIKAFTTANNLDMGVRTGIHSGKVFFGAIGSTHKHDITIVGDAVNVAARTVGAAGPFEVLVTDTVLLPIEREVEHSARPPIMVKGKSTPLELHAVHAPAEGSAHYVRKRSQARFLAGRDAALKEVLAAVDEALAGRGRSLAIRGERGSGKSALLSHLINRAADHGATGLLGRCRYATRSVPLAPIVSMFSSFLGLSSGDTEAERRERIRNGFAPFHLDRGAPELIALLQPVRRPDGTTEALIDLADSDAREGVLQSIVEFVDKRVQQEPLVYVLEDVHLADSLTLQLISRLLRSVTTGAFLFVITYRPDSILNDVRRHVPGEIELGALPIKAVEQLTRYELGVDKVDPELLVLLWQRTNGNPGHVVEIVRFLSERALLRIRGGEVSPAEPGLSMLEDVVPTTLAQVALARLDELGAIERRVLRVASAIGRRFGRAVLEVAAAAEVRQDFVDEAMATLQGQGVIVSSSHEQEGFMFSDSITRAVAYGTIPETERRALHRRIADAMEKLVDGGGQSVAMLAMHRERGGQFIEAAACYERAARLAMRAGLEREAIDLVERWEVAVTRVVVKDQPDAKRRLRMSLLRFVATARRGVPAETLRYGRLILAEEGKVLDASSRTTVDYWLGQALMLLGEADKASLRLGRVFETATEAATKGDAARLLARVSLGRGDLGKARVWIERARGIGGSDEYRHARLDLVDAEVRVAEGDVGGAEARVSTVHGFGREHRQANLIAECAATLARVQLAAGDTVSARATFSEALEMFRASGRLNEEAAILVGLGQSCLYEGLLDEARGHLERGLAVAQDIGDEVTVAAAQVHLGAALAWSVDPVEGVAMCTRGRDMAVRIGQKAIQVAGDLHLLKAALLQHDSPAAAKALTRCRAESGELKLPLLARVFQELTNTAPETASAD
jgi:class 3 adenylate cyclase/tetratricopeptide (TPR) repeat protein